MGEICVLRILPDPTDGPHPIGTWQILLMGMGEICMLRIFPDPTGCPHPVR